MSRAILAILASAVVAAALVQPDAALAYDGAAITQGTDSGVDVLVAYVDPGAAGFVIVTVLGFVSAIGYTARAYLGRLWRLAPGVGRRGRRDEGDAS